MQACVTSCGLMQIMMDTTAEWHVHFLANISGEIAPFCQPIPPIGLHISMFDADHARHTAAERSGHTNEWQSKLPALEMIPHRINA